MAAPTSAPRQRRTELRDSKRRGRSRGQPPDTELQRRGRLKRRRSTNQTLQFGDINGDHRAEVCGRGSAGIWCATSVGRPSVRCPCGTGTSASRGLGTQGGSTTRLSGSSTVTATTGRRVRTRLRRDQLRAEHGRELSPPSACGHELGDAAGWKAPEYYSTIRFP